MIFDFLSSSQMRFQRVESSYIVWPIASGIWNTEYGTYLVPKGFVHGNDGEGENGSK